MTRTADDLRLDGPAPAPTARGRLRAAWPSLRTLVFRLHWALGLSAGLVLCLVGVTGALMSYEDAIEAVVDADRAVVPVLERPHLALEALTARIEAQNPGLRVSTLTLSGEAGVAPRARFGPDPRTGARPPTLYVDPYDGTVIGPMRWEAGFATVRALHRWLLLPGEGKGWGRQVTGACAIALLVFLGTGLYLRWPAFHRWRIWLKPSLARPGRARWWSLHAVAGTWLLPIYAVIALSGLWWSYEWYRAGATWLLTGASSEARGPTEARKSAETRKLAEARLQGAPALDRAWVHFSAGHDAILAVVTVPKPESAKPGAATIRIRWIDRAADEPKARNETLYDAATGAVVSETLYAEASLGRRMADNMLEVHRGRFFGGFFALLFSLAALAMPVFAATGLTLYVLRRRAVRSAVESRR